MIRLIQTTSAAARLNAAIDALPACPANGALVVGASRGAADEFAARLAVLRGGLFGVVRVAYQELITRLALPALARDGLSLSGALSAEAVAARASFTARSADALEYFAPVATLPGFPRALSRTLSDITLAGISPAALAGVDSVGSDLAALLSHVDEQRSKAGTVDRASLLRIATDVLLDGKHSFQAASLVLLDVSLPSRADAAFARALLASAEDVIVTVPVGDDRTIEVLVAAGARIESISVQSTAAIGRVQTHLFSPDLPPRGEADDSVQLFSAPGEGRECVEIARRVLDEAARGVPFDEIAVVLRAPNTYFGLLEHAFTRAGLPAWFDRGTRRPDPSGRAFLALLACADEELSARRFAEYLSLAQVPSDEAERAATWSTPVDEIVEAVVPQTERTVDPELEEEARIVAREGARGRVVAGTLRAPWRWEELLVESAVIGGLDRWERRLRGLRAEYLRKRDELASDEPESPRIHGLQRDIDQLDHLRAFALPIVREMAEWPSGGALWREWLTALQVLAPRVLRQPARVQRVLQELAPLSDVGPIALREVREVLSERLLTLTHEPPRRRHGRVFVGTPHAARGRTFRVAFVPGLAERVFPQRLREDALLLDQHRRALSSALTTQKQRADDERLQLRLAVGAASERLYLSWPRLELQESRPRVPSFYVLDLARAVEGRLPAYADVRDRAHAAGGATLAWPAPADPRAAIDAFEHDLAMLYQLLREGDRAAAKGRARYLYELSPNLQRSLTTRWARWQNRWHTADGPIRSTPAIAPALASQRLGARSFSLSALQRFADCPYQFHLSAIYQLAPLEEPAPLQRLDPLTRGSLFHAIQTELLRTLEKNQMLPLDAQRAEAARGMLDWAIGKVTKAAYDELAPAIDRVWYDEIAAMARDLRGWLDQLVRDGSEWRPELFEFAFGLQDTIDRDPRSVAEAARIDGRFLIRGAIDLVERRRDGKALRVTDHKTGKNRTNQATMVGGGRVLQPVLYGMALEALLGELVVEGRLSYCTNAANYTVHHIALNEVSRRRAIEVLEVIDRAIERGTLAARPDDGACGRCDFSCVCGGDEERRTRRKQGAIFADLDELRRIP